MNKTQLDLMLEISNVGYTNQRKIARSLGKSPALINRSIRELVSFGFLDSNFNITKKAEDFINSRSPENAIIVAAGFGLRMIPINMDCPKGLVEVMGEKLIERLIRHLKEVGIEDIYIVVGYMKEKYEYLIDSFGVKLIVNDSYATKNNIHSLAKAVDKLSNSYIVPCDIWCAKNPFSPKEVYSWYMLSDDIARSFFKINKNSKLYHVSSANDGNRMMSLGYFTKSDSQILSKIIVEMCDNPQFDNERWEAALLDKRMKNIAGREVKGSDFIGINTYEELRSLDKGSKNLKANTIESLKKILSVRTGDIRDVELIKKGMTNRSFSFTCKGKKYVMRIPGRGTDKLIKRREEASVYKEIENTGLCSSPIYFDPDDGFKLSLYLENARSCDPYNWQEVKECMELLKGFHDLDLNVDHYFDLTGQIDFYESLREGPSSYSDYDLVKKQLMSLTDFVDINIEEKCLCHIDSVPDNFLFYTDEDGREKLQLTDWEYAGMQDPHLDIAMFSVYSGYNKKEIDRLIDLYFSGVCPPKIRTKIYCYVALSGLLWSNWCEYKYSLGLEFGEYSLNQYRYAKDFYRIAEKEILNYEN